VREAGGQAETNREAFAILLNDDGVRGVGHCARNTDGSTEDFAPVIFGNAAPSVLAALLSEPARSNFNTFYRTRRPSISLWTISLGLSRPSREFGVQRYSTAIFPTWVTALSDLRQAGALLHDDPEIRVPPYGFVAYDQIDSGLNREGPYLASMVGVDRLKNWMGLDAEAAQGRKERWMDRIIADLDQQFPGIASVVVQREMSTAQTFQHHLNTPEGAIYGFAPQIPGFSPLPQTKIGGLYLASAFTGTGGLTGAILGGGWAARAATKAGLKRRRPLSSSARCSG
jgi:all-trans-retinol 13,14-reductase